MQKKIWKNLLLVVVMAVLCVAVGVTASAETWGDYEYRVIEDGTVEITGYNGNSPDLEIPAEIDGKIVTVIGSNAFEPNRTDIERVTLPDTIVEIGVSAFCQCMKLESINIPDSVVSIEANAFNGCPKLKSITISKNVSYIGDYAFVCCFLEKYYVDENNEYFTSDSNGVLFNKDKSTLIYYPAGSLASEYIVPDSVTEIGEYAFAYSFNLTKITIPDSVSKIDMVAFEGCFRLENIDFPKGLSKLNGGVLSFCLSLTEIHIPNHIKELDDYAIIDCYYTDKIYIESMDTKFGESSANVAYVSIDLTKERAIDLLIRAVLDEEPYVDENDEIYQYLTYHQEEFYLSTIYCHAGSTAEAYAIENGVDYELTHFFEGEWTYDYDNMIRTRKCIHCEELETEALEITGDSDVEIIEPVDPDTDFIVDEITDYVVIEETISNNVVGDFEIVKAFDITMKNKDGVHVQPDGTVKVKLPLDWSKDGIYKVYRVNDDGTLTDMNAYRQGSHMVFETDHFSIYVIVDESEKAEEPTTPDEPQEETKYGFFSKIIDLIKSLFELIASWFKK